MPSSAAADPAGCPSSTVTIPALGAANPTTRFNRVLLPAPLGPTSAATCPGEAAGLHPGGASAWPYRLPGPFFSPAFIPPLRLRRGLRVNPSARGGAAPHPLLRPPPPLRPWPAIRAASGVAPQVRAA